MYEPGMAFDSMKIKNPFGTPPDTYDQDVLNFLKQAAPVMDEFTARYGNTPPPEDYLQSRGLIRPKRQRATNPAPTGYPMLKMGFGA